MNTTMNRIISERNIEKKMNSEVYLKSPSGSWDGYKGEKIVLINDMTKEEWKYIKFNLKKWIDYEKFLSSPVKDRMTKMSHNLSISLN